MEIDQSLMYTLLPIVGIIIGALLQYIFSKHSEELKHQQNLKTQAYVDFLKGVSGITVTHRNNNKTKEQEYTTLLVDAKTRISIYGSKEVIQKIANFWRSDAKVDTPEEKHLFIEICQAMRSDSLKKDQRVENKDISQLLFSEDLD